MTEKKRVLLVTCAAPSQTPFSTWEKRPPLGVGFLISMLRGAGHEVFFIDNYLKPSDFLENGYLYVNRIDYIGIYVSTICFRDTLRMLHKIEYIRRSGKWRGKIMVGGPHTTVSLETIPDFVDHIVQGEGEQAIVDIVDGTVLDRVVKYPRIDDLDSLPMQAWDDFIKLPYSWEVHWFQEKPVFTMTTSRGCPYNCSFCSVNAVWGKKYTYFSAKRIINEIEYLIEHYGAKGIYFREDNFTLNRKRVVEFCNLLLKKNINISWACESRVDNLDGELLELMYKAGARGFYFGVESGSQRILDFLDKGITVDQIKETFALCHDIGFKTAASIVVGVPHETKEDLTATDKLLEEIKPSVTWHNVFVGIPSSKLYHHVIEHNLYEFIDDRGLVYLKGHNDRAKLYYNNSWDASIPVNLESPSVSVIMAAYNASTYLKESIRSILKQTYQDFELIIVDDASSDDTGNILKQFSDPRIRIIKNSMNIGPAASRNKAIAVARGNYLAIMDADDISLPHRFESQIRFLESNTTYDLVGSFAYQIDESGQYQSVIKVQTDDNEIRKCLIQVNNFVHGSVMIRRHVLLQIGCYDCRFKYAHDYDLFLRIIERYKVANLPEPLYCWRSSRAQISSAKKKDQDKYAEMARQEAKKRADENAYPGMVYLERRNNNSADNKRDDIELSASYGNCIIIPELVSIIIPTFNCVEWVCDAVDAALNQTYRKCEVIVIDDGSTDDTERILRSKYNERIKYIFQKNIGLSAARNRGIAEAKGEYIQFLDSDDIISNDKIEVQVRSIKNVRGYAISYSDYQSINIKDNSINTRRYLSPRTNTESFFYSLITDWETRFSVPIHCFLFNSRIFHDLQIRFDVSLPNHEDWDCWIRIFACNPTVVYVDQKLAFYRIKPSAMCSDRALMRYGFIKSICKYMDQYQHDSTIFELLKIKKEEIEGCYRDVSRADIRSVENKMTAKNNSQKEIYIETEDSRYAQTNLIAFYLPQYHPIPENDRWWGKGFTEWTNVAKAKPLFPGHYQPHLPADLGFYDLRLPEVREAQAEMAKEYGISGFCYYHYWFNGKRLLHRVFDEVIASGKPDFPFCLCWANENWTRAWDGQNFDILIKQNYSPEDDLKHISYLSRIFNDRRYIRVDGKPLFIVYRAGNMPDPLKTTSLWREKALRMGFGDLFLCRVERFVEDMKDPHSLGFDAAIEFQPDGIRLGKPIEDPKYKGNFVYEYEDMVRAALSKKNPEYLRFPCVCPSWDNSPRRQENAVIFNQSTPELYESWLKEVVTLTASRRPEERIVFINAFNEWGEGCHLEPDQMNGRAYLEATHRAILACKKDNTSICRETSQYLDAKGESEIRREASRYTTVNISSGDTTRVSIIIPLFNKLEFTKQCLKALIENTPDELYDVVIVDNASTDGTNDFLSTLEGDVTIIKNKTNLGFAKACNQGANVAKGAYLMFLNNDTEPQKGWLEPLIKIMDSDPAVAATGSKLLFPDGTIQHAGVAIIEDRKLPDPLVARHIFYQQSADWHETNELRTYQALTAACIIIRRDSFEKVGGFDEGYWNGYEDVDLCFKLQEKGWKLVYQPESVVIHHESKSGPERFSKVNQNINRLHDRWIGKIKPDVIINKDGSITNTDAHRIKKYILPIGNKSCNASVAPEKRNKLVSIIIPTFNQLKYTKKCIDSIKHHTPECHEIIFVDNGSTDGTRDYLVKIQKYSDHVHLILNDTNLGFAAANNQAIQKATGEYVLLLNNDVVVTEGWLERLLSHIEQSPDIGMVGPMSNSVSGPQLVEKVQYGKKLKAMQAFARKFAKNNSGKVTEVLRLVGFCLLIKKEVLDVIGCFDEKYASGNFEDDDLCLRSYIAGYKHIIAGDVFVHHYGSMTFKGNSIDYSATMKKNLSYFGEKWKDIIEINETGYRIHVSKEQGIQTLISWGEGKYASGDLKSAIRIFERVLKLDKRNSQALSNLGVIQWQLGKAISAIDTFQSALFLDPKDPDALANLVQAASELNRFDLIQDNLIDLLRQYQPGNPDFQRLIEVERPQLNA